MVRDIRGRAWAFMNGTHAVIRIFHLLRSCTPPSHGILLHTYSLIAGISNATLFIPGVSSFAPESQSQARGIFHDIYWWLLTPPPLSPSRRGFLTNRSSQVPLRRVRTSNGSPGPTLFQNSSSQTTWRSGSSPKNPAIAEDSRIFTTSRHMDYQKSPLKGLKGARNRPPGFLVQG